MNQQIGDLKIHQELLKMVEQWLICNDLGRCYQEQIIKLNYFYRIYY